MLAPENNAGRSIIGVTIAAGTSAGPSAQLSSLPDISETEPLSPEVSSRLSHGTPTNSQRRTSISQGDASLASRPPLAAESSVIGHQLAYEDTAEVLTQETPTQHGDLSSNRSASATGSGSISRHEDDSHIPASSTPYDAGALHEDTSCGIDIAELPEEDDQSAAEVLEGSPAAGSSISEPEPSMPAMPQNVRMSRGCYGAIESIDGSLWDPEASSDSQSEQGGSLQSGGDEYGTPQSQACSQAAGDGQGPGSRHGHSRPHSTSSSDEWLQKQAGSSSTSSRHSSSHSSSHSSQAPHSGSPSGDSSLSFEASDCHEQAAAHRAADASEASAGGGLIHRGSDSDGQSSHVISPAGWLSASSSEGPSAGSAGVASLSAGMASQAASPAASQSGRTPGASDATSQHSTGSTDSAASADHAHAPTGSIASMAVGSLPRSQSMDVEVGSLAGDWQQDASRLGLRTPGAACSDSQPPPASVSSPEGSPAVPCPSALVPEQQTPAALLASSPSFVLGGGNLSGASPIQQATPFLVLGCGRARGSSPEEQATPQFPLFGRPVQVSAPTAKQPLLSAPESDDGWHTPPPRALPEPILVTEAVTSAVQVQTGGMPAEQGPVTTTHVPCLPQQASGVPDHAGDLMAPPVICTPVMPRAYPPKARAASKRAAPGPSEPQAASRMGRSSSGTPLGGIAAAAPAPKPTSVFLTTPPPPTAPKVSSRTRKRSPKPDSIVSQEPGLTTHAQEGPPRPAGQGPSTPQAPSQAAAGPSERAGPALQPARKPNGSAAKPPLPGAARKQRGARMSRFAPQGARPAVQTARIHAELGIPAVVPPPEPSQPKFTSASAVPTSPKLEHPINALPEPGSAELMHGGHNQTAEEDDRGAPISPSGQVGVPEGQQGVDDESQGLIEGEPGRWQQLQQLAEDASDPAQHQPQEPLHAPKPVQGYSIRQFEHPGTTPFPVPKRGHSNYALESQALATPLGQDLSCPTPAVFPALGPPGHTPFPHRATESSSGSVDHQETTALEVSSSAAKGTSSDVSQQNPKGSLAAVSAVLEEAEGSASMANAVPLRMLMQHLQGGAYDSPAANKPLKFVADSSPDSSPATPPAQVGVQSLSAPWMLRKLAGLGAGKVLMENCTAFL